MIPFTLYTADTMGNRSNTIYTNKIEIKDAESLENAARFDHVAAEYQDNKRSNDNFMQANCLPLDCDNSHTDDPNQWVTPFEVELAFPDVAFAVVYSRNHMKPKSNQTARPRFHVYFPISPVQNAIDYAELKRKVAEVFPYFDEAALDSSRFFFGVEIPEVDIYDGELTVNEFINPPKTLDEFEAFCEAYDKVKHGGRNNYMSGIAGKLVYRYDPTDEAHEVFLRINETKLEEPLESDELAQIWRSACKFYENKVKNNPDRIPPDQYNVDLRLKPDEYTDLGQAMVLAREYANKIGYSPETSSVFYNGSYWEESDTKVQAIAQELTIRQLKEAEVEVDRTMAEMVKNGAMDIILTKGIKKAPALLNPAQKHAFDQYEAAQVYKKYALKRQESKLISSALKEVKPMVEFDFKKLDEDPLLLNTPAATYDLRTGQAKAHNPSDYISKQTEVDPGHQGEKIWQDALDTIFCQDLTLVEYVQRIVGLAAIGTVKMEGLIIAYGGGRNGKSTFWNSIARVLGTYSGSMSSDALTANSRSNIKNELAVNRGKRLIIAAELGEGMRLSDSNLKRLTSTDPVSAEKKFKDTFSYIPSHTLILYSNHLPKVGARDSGTLERLNVVPFEAKIVGNSDIKNYGDYLYKNAGGAILSWIIEGAQKIIADDFRVEMPEKVLKATQEYQENNDWFAHFISDCMDIGETFEEKSGEVYATYRAYCDRVGEYKRGSADFYKELENEGFTRFRTPKGRYIKGLRLKSEWDD